MLLYSVLDKNLTKVFAVCLYTEIETEIGKKDFSLAQKYPIHIANPPLLQNTRKQTTYTSMLSPSPLEHDRRTRTKTLYKSTTSPQNLSNH
jgi:hypothetical protein